MRRSQRIGYVFAFLLSCTGLCRADMAVTEAEAKEAAITRTSPEYSPMARQLKVTGKVGLEIVIGTAGNVEDIKVAYGNPLLSKSCVKAVSDWKFKPFQQKGASTRATAPLTFEFK